MTSDKTIRKTAQVIGSVMSRWDMDGRPAVPGGVDVMIARALAEAGLLAPAPLTEEWRVYDRHTGGVGRALDQAQAALTAHELAMDDADDGIDSEWAVQHRFVSAWLPVDRDEGDGRADQ